MGIFSSCFFGCFMLSYEQAHREVHCDYSCPQVWTNFISHFGSPEGPKMGLFGETGKNFYRTAGLELHYQYKSCREGSKGHFGAKFLQSTGPFFKSYWLLKFTDKEYSW